MEKAYVPVQSHLDQIQTTESIGIIENLPVQRNNWKLREAQPKAIGTDEYFPEAIGTDEYFPAKKLTNHKKISAKSWPRSNFISSYAPKKTCPALGGSHQRSTSAS